MMVQYFQEIKCTGSKWQVPIVDSQADMGLMHFLSLEMA